jgi:bifunctional non-homologous end joining protein LigD
LIINEAWEALTRLLSNTERGIPLSEHMDGADGESVFRHAWAMGLEGIVAKRRDRPYRSGRTTDWIKVRNSAAAAVTRLLLPVLGMPAT